MTALRIKLTHPPFAPMKFLIPLLLLATTLRAQDPRQIINRYLDKVSNGNVDNWYRIKSTYSESEVYYSHQTYQQKASLFTADKPSFNKTYRRLPHDSKVELYDDSTYTNLTSRFYYRKDKIIILLGTMPAMIKQRSTKEEFLRDLLPLHLSGLIGKKSVAMQVIRVREFPVDGFSCYEISMKTRERTYTLFINTDTFLLEYWNDREDGDLSILIKLYDYKDIEGLLIPMSESSSVNGQTYYWSHIRMYVINPDLDPEVFEYK